MTPMLNRLSMVFLGVALALSIAVAQKGDQAEVQLKAAIQKEVVDGNLKAAIEQYKKLASGSNREVAAKALVRMGECYEKLGDVEASKFYERVVREFPDQKDALAAAQQHLAANSAHSEAGIVMRRVAAYPDNRRYLSISRDGRYLTFTKDDGSMYIILSRARYAGLSQRYRRKRPCMRSSFLMAGKSPM